MVGITRKYISAFGSLFRNLTVREWDHVNKVWLNEIEVPISYGPKEKALARVEVRNQRGFLDDIAMTLPRISWSLIGFHKDTNRILNKRNYYVGVIQDDGNKVQRQYVGTPYNFEFELSFMVKYAEHGTQLVEQILPMFTPQLNMILNITGINNITLDTPIILNDVTLSDEYEDDFKKRRVIIWTLNFTLKGVFLSSVEQIPIIKTVVVNFGTESNAISKDIYTTIPIMEGKTISEILITDDYGFSTTGEEL